MSAPVDRLQEFEEKWANITVGPHNFAEVNNDFLIALLLTPDGQPGNGNMSAYITRNADGSGIQLPLARPELIRPIYDIDATASQAVQSLYISNYNILIKIYDEQLACDRVTYTHETALKGAIMNAATWGTVLAAKAKGTGTQSVTDHCADMWARVARHLDVLDDEAVLILNAIYTTQWEGSFEDLRDAELPIHTILVASGRNHTEDQRMRYLRSVVDHRQEVRTALESFDLAHPSTALRTLASLSTYMISQDPNIKRGMDMNRVAIYPNALSSVASPPPGSIAALSRDTAAMSMQRTETFSQIQMEEYAAQAVAAAAASQQRRRAEPSGTNGISDYCHKHGVCLHNGRDCDGIAFNETCHWKKHDTRTVLDAHGVPDFDRSRVFGHVNCRHEPKCISVSNAKKATGPLSFPDTPGNAYVYARR